MIAMLVAFVNGARNEAVTQPCATVQTSSSVVALGSPVRATCVIRDDCPPASGQAVHIEWRLNDRSVPDSSVANESGRISEVVLQSFNDTRAVLTCCIQASPAVILGGVEIRAGYPPSAPENLYCYTNLTSPSTISCRWDPGQRETHLPTKYSLHTHIRDSNENFTYKLFPGKHRCTIPRSDFVFFSEMEIYVKVMNELGETASHPVILEPISAAKFDPPKILNIQAIPKRYGCLRLTWALSQHQTWMKNTRLNLELRLRTTDHGQWSEKIIALNLVRASRPVDQCRLLHGTRYISQIRVRYQQSPWSEWSSSQSGVTLESAPTGLLDSWVKTSGDQMHKQRNIHLFWKPSKQFRANGQNVSYVVSLQKGEKGQVCNTVGNYCSFQLPVKAKKVYLSAVNAAGKSTPTEVRIYTPKAHSTLLGDIIITPYDNRSLLVRWAGRDSSALTGYVVEWKPLLHTDPSFVGFDIVHRNQSSLIITGSFEPYKPYGISVYPRFKDGIGLPQTANAYSRQKAPSVAPKMRIKKTWKSHVELTWDEIPLDQRNGIIQSYRVFYWAQKGPVSVVNAKPEERRVLLKDLNNRLLYEAFMMVSTLGGNYNGSVIRFGVEPFDAVTIVMIAISSCVPLSFMFICLIMTCFSNHKRLKRRLWPIVPDPANSSISIRKWSSESLQESLRTSDSEEPNPVYLSHLSFLDLPTALTKEEDWLNNPEDTSDLGESICGSPFIPGYSGTNSDSVPYATIICSSPCSSPPSKDCHVYMRSESTQPLLETEEAFTPKCYQIMSSDRMMKREQCFFGPCPNDEAEGEAEIVWDEFPFLRALAMNEPHND